MRILIDGYNLMYAGGLLGKRLGPDGLRKVRHRFLNDLADRLGPLDAPQTTVVFDASQPPDGLPSQTPHKGLTVVYAVNDADADARIETLIARHSHPKGLTVVSSDRRIRQAALRRKARAVTAHDYWNELDARRRPPRVRSHTEAPSPAAEEKRPFPTETEFWLREFADLDAQPETREALNPDGLLLTDEEVARLEREIEREFP
ncbi:MAG: NYN domain-containing protein [Isosphaeraceae bacterium]